jgi:hypothetical protein
LKIERAEMHARNLTQSITDWLARSPPTARADFIADRHGYRLILEQFTEPPLRDEWGLLIGDCVHNLRSALDNLCFALAVQRCDPPRDPRGIYFPVSGNADTFARSAKSTLEQVSPQVADCLRQWQPFNRGAQDAIARDALNLLHHLSSQDKHRVPQVVLISLNQRDHLVNMEFDTSADALAFVQGPPDMQLHGGVVEPGTVLVQAIGNRRIKKIEGRVTVEAVPAIQTLFALEGAIPTVAALCRHTAEIVRYFRDRFFTAARS